MELTISDVISIVTLLLGGGGVGFFFTWRYNQRKEKAEAEVAETSAAKEMQDMYQQLIDDVKKDRDEKKDYIQELKEDRTRLREERDELRKRQDALEEAVRQLKCEVARNGRMVEAMRPFLCGRRGCSDRMPVTLSDDGDAEPRKRTTKKKGGEA